MRIDSSGRLLVGKTTQSVTAEGSRIDASGKMYLSTEGTGSSLQIGFYRNAGATAVGSIVTTSVGTTYATTSDYRLKDITGPIENSGDYIDSLNPVEGTWKADGSTFVGLIAHEAQEASRTLVATGEKDGEEMQGMDYSAAEIVANLIKEVQLLRSRVAQLENS
jgi:hypothetical protein